MKTTRKYRPLTMAQFEARFPTEDACRRYLMRRRWPADVCCPRCGSLKVYELPSRPWHWQCHDCAPNGYRFSVLVNTIFENTKVPLKGWFKVIYLMLAGKKSMSALQIHRMMGFGSYRTAWKMRHKVRVALGNVEFRKLVGFVDVDEAHVGGKAGNQHQVKGGRGGSDLPGLRSRVRPPMTRQDEIAAVSAEKSLPADRVKALRSIGMDSIRGEFILRLLRARTPVDTLSIYWERAPEFISTGQVEDVVRKLVFGRRSRVTGEFMDRWLLGYPDDGEIKQSVEREIDRMVGAVAALVAQRSN